MPGMRGVRTSKPRSRHTASKISILQAIVERVRDWLGVHCVRALLDGELQLSAWHRSPASELEQILLDLLELGFDRHVLVRIWRAR